MLSTSDSYFRILWYILVGILLIKFPWIFLYEYSFKSGDEAFIQFIYDIPFLLLLLVASILIPIYLMHTISVWLVKISCFIVSKFLGINLDSFNWKSNIYVFVFLYAVIGIIYFILHKSWLSPTTFNISNSDLQSIFSLFIPSGLPIILLILGTDIYFRDIRKRKN